MRAVTDSFSEIRFSDEAERGGVQNLLTIYQALTNDFREKIEFHFDGKGYGDLKKAVVEQVIERLTPLQARYNQFINEQGYLDTVLAQGAEKASQVAEQTLAVVRDKIGLLPRR